MSFVADAIDRRWRELLEYRTSPVDASMTIAERACSEGAPDWPAAAGAPASHAASTAANVARSRLTG